MRDDPKEPTAPPMYPELHDDANMYRLNKISELEQRLTKEKDDRKSLYKKYKRAINVADGFDVTFKFIGISLGAAGIGLLTTIVGLPIVLPLEVSALVCGLFGIAGKFVSRRLQLKANKHDELKVIASTKLNSVRDLISKAINNGKISQEEFSFILDEFEQYNKIKSEFRKKNIQTSDEQQQLLLKKVKAEAVEKIKNSLQNV